MGVTYGEKVEVSTVCQFINYKQTITVETDKVSFELLAYATNEGTSLKLQSVNGEALDVKKIGIVKLDGYGIIANYPSIDEDLLLTETGLYIDPDNLKWSEQKIYSTIVCGVEIEFSVSDYIEK